MTNLKMDEKKGQCQENMSWGQIQLQCSQLQTGIQISDFLSADTQAVDDWWREKKITLLAVAVLHLQPWSPSPV